MRDPKGAATEAIARARSEGIRLWLATGAIGAYSSIAPSVSTLAEISAQCQWLSTLSCDMDSKASDPIKTLLARGLARLGAAARLLGREDEDLSPESFLSLQFEAKPIAFVDLATQQDRIRGELERRIDTVLRHGHYIMGPEIAELETKLAAYVGTRSCITCASGTDSLEIALRALGIGQGDEVITTPFTWISTAETIAQVGAAPVFVDIEPDYFNIDVEQIEQAITPRTKAIMPVSLFGQMADLGRINAIAQKHGLPVIEDGAQSFGATQRGRRSCGMSTIGSTSFFPAKPLGCYGDGGALFTDDDNLAACMKAIRTHGGERRHYHPYIGMNGRMDTLQAAIVLAKMPSWEWEVEQRKIMGARYTELIVQAEAKNGKGAKIIPPTVQPDNTHVYAQYTLRSMAREELAARLKRDNVPTAIYYPKCLHEQPCFSNLGYTYGSFPESEKASREVLSLPMSADLTRSDQVHVVDRIFNFA
jgi:UDP-2-acetamido-2-deoxy-ribo-hexuluronate aminotransferase